MDIKGLIRSVEVGDTKRASLICALIPSACPFARTIHLGRVTLTIPPLCKVNPFYEDLMELRFRAQCYLAEEA